MWGGANGIFLIKKRSRRTSALNARDTKKPGQKNRIESENEGERGRKTGKCIRERA